MRNASCNTECNAICRQLSEIRLSAHDRQSAAHALRQAEAIADAVIWVKEGIASLGAMLPRLGFKH
jgi:hypothetical protein